jgi:hypothetical protein
MASVLINNTLLYMAFGLGVLLLSGFVVLILSNFYIVRILFQKTPVSEGETL